MMRRTRNGFISFLIFCLACLIGCGQIGDGGRRPQGALEVAGSPQESPSTTALSQRVDALYEWYVPNAMPIWPRTAFDDRGPFLEGKDTYLAKLAESGYFSNQFMDSLHTAFDECEIEGRAISDLDHLGCEEADVLCFYFVEKLDGIAEERIQIQGDEATVHLEVNGSGIAPAGITYHVKAQMRLRFILEKGQWLLRSSAYEI